MEAQVSFAADGINIEGLFDHRTDSKAVIITHPHPLYGGDMNNTVVSTIQQAYSKIGYSTLRFNFRGVGQSEGSFDNGMGEQSDLRAAYDYLLSKEFQAVDLAGYSFGSWVGASLACKSGLFKNVTLVSPPVSFMDFNDISQIPALRLIVIGGNDDFANLDTLRTSLSMMNAEAQLEIISNTDHFFTGGLGQLSAIIEACQS